VPAALDEGKIAARIVDAREVDESAVGEAHEVSTSSLANYDDAGGRFASS
jgi:hypothetical protein